ncbi:hypothetical protein [Psychrobacter cryohalolentis]|uniref:Uncharacterized protein n=1 Tax=Psychrobacter cryohalolentis (strain ATCC BAA-1226 / DSM 17306 / VKM B-2378 / K5) TaxID=335284 RepID=Q1Q9I0_PSYCK|nr:hypothetical protein [Psychrobacter cryohalolentis]ABE75673.1 hypothetical protein Pcryo_1896 [Psychrobacter cryohalolentis K5]ASE25864.1 hypothetical protein CEP87_04435 [Psychrobacter cryohalolentis]
MNDNKKSLDTNSSAENVEQHLQELEKADYERLYYSQEQTFSADELANTINERRLNELMAQSDEFLSGLNSEIEDFDE